MAFPTALLQFGHWVTGKACLAGGMLLPPGTKTTRNGRLGAANEDEDRFAEGDARWHPPRVGLLAFGMVRSGILAAGVAPREAAAQFVCDRVTPGGADSAMAATPGDVACGTNAAASGGNSSAYGDASTASGSFNSAYGVNSTASGAESSAYGFGSTAAFDGSAAFGFGATTTRADQQAFGTASNTYTMAGITSAASKAAQGAPTHLVTSNTSGDVAAYTFAELGLVSAGDVSGLQSQIDRLERRDNKLTEGIATVAALAQPMLLPGQHFAMRAGWGGYEDANAIGVSAAGVIASNLLNQGRGTLTLDGGVGFGTSEGEVAGRAGMSFGW
jgi:hypothetical protein